MEGDYDVGDWGSAHFYTKSKGITQGFTLHGTIGEIEKKYLLFIDNDNIEYYAIRSSFEFIKKQKPF